MGDIFARTCCGLGSNPGRDRLRSALEANRLSDRIPNGDTGRKT